MLAKEAATLDARTGGRLTLGPGVDVVLLRLQKRDAPCLDPVEIAEYGDFVAYLFSAWKPTVREALRGIVTSRQLAGLEGDVGRPLAVAPGRLPGNDWIALYRAMRAHPAISLEQVSGAWARLECQRARLRKEHRTRNGRQQTRNGKTR